MSEADEFFDAATGDEIYFHSNNGSNQVKLETMEHTESSDPFGDFQDAPVTQDGGTSSNDPFDHLVAQPIPSNFSGNNEILESSADFGDFVDAPGGNDPSRSLQPSEPTQYNAWQGRSETPNEGAVYQNSANPYLETNKFSNETSTSLYHDPFASLSTPSEPMKLPTDQFSTTGGYDISNNFNSTEPNGITHTVSNDSYPIDNQSLQTISFEKVEPTVYGNAGSTEVNENAAGFGLVYGTNAQSSQLNHTPDTEINNFGYQGSSPAINTYENFNTFDAARANESNSNQPSNRINLNGQGIEMIDHFGQIQSGNANTENVVGLSQNVASDFETAPISQGHSIQADMFGGFGGTVTSSASEVLSVGINAFNPTPYDVVSDPFDAFNSIAAAPAIQAASVENYTIKIGTSPVINETTIASSSDLQKDDSTSLGPILVISDSMIDPINNLSDSFGDFQDTVATKREELSDDPFEHLAAEPTQSHLSAPDDILEDSSDFGEFVESSVSCEPSPSLQAFGSADSGFQERLEPSNEDLVYSDFVSSMSIEATPSRIEDSKGAYEDPFENLPTSLESTKPTVPEGFDSFDTFNVTQLNDTTPNLPTESHPIDHHLIQSNLAEQIDTNTHDSNENFVGFVGASDQMPSVNHVAANETNFSVDQGSRLGINTLENFNTYDITQVNESSLNQQNNEIDRLGQAIEAIDPFGQIESGNTKTENIVGLLQNTLSTFETTPISLAHSIEGDIPEGFGDAISSSASELRSVEINGLNSSPSDVMNDPFDAFNSIATASDSQTAHIEDSDIKTGVLSMVNEISVATLPLNTSPSAVMNDPFDAFNSIATNLEPTIEASAPLVDPINQYFNDFPQDASEYKEISAIGTGENGSHMVGSPLIAEDTFTVDVNRGTEQHDTSRDDMPHSNFHSNDNDNEIDDDFGDFTGVGNTTANTEMLTGKATESHELVPTPYEETENTLMDTAVGFDAFDGIDTTVESQSEEYKTLSSELETAATDKGNGVNASLSTDTGPETFENFGDFVEVVQSVAEKPMDNDETKTASAAPSIVDDNNTIIGTNAGEGLLTTMISTKDEDDGNVDGVNADPFEKCSDGQQIHSINLKLENSDFLGFEAKESIGSETIPTPSLDDFDDVGFGDFGEAPQVANDNVWHSEENFTVVVDSESMNAGNLYSEAKESAESQATPVPNGDEFDADAFGDSDEAPQLDNVSLLQPQEFVSEVVTSRADNTDLQTKESAGTEETPAPMTDDFDDDEDDFGDFDEAPQVANDSLLQPQEVSSEVVASSADNTDFQTKESAGTEDTPAPMTDNFDDDDDDFGDFDEAPQGANDSLLQPQEVNSEVVSSTADNFQKESTGSGETPTPLNDDFDDDDDFGDFDEAPQVANASHDAKSEDGNFGDFSSFPNQNVETTESISVTVNASPLLNHIHTTFPKLFAEKYAPNVDDSSIDDVDQGKEVVTIEALLSSLDASMPAVSNDESNIPIIDLLQDTHLLRKPTSTMIKHDGIEPPFAHLFYPLDGFMQREHTPGRLLKRVETPPEYTLPDVLPIRLPSLIESDSQLSYTS